MIIPSLIIWIILIPLLFFIKLQNASKNNLLDTKELRLSFGYLYNEVYLSFR